MAHLFCFCFALVWLEQQESKAGASVSAENL